MTGKKKEPEEKVAYIGVPDSADEKIAIQSEQPVAKIKQSPPPKDD